MDAQQIMETVAFRQCAEFHGHICPGLSIGFKAARVALEGLKESRSEDEEIVAVVENDACYVDAVQVLTGCTFGKGNLIYKDYGKMVLTLLRRKTSQGVRVAMRPGAFAPDETHLSLLRKVMSCEADPEEANRFHELHLKRSCDVLEMPDDEFFIVKSVKQSCPPRPGSNRPNRAPGAASRPCAQGLKTKAA